MNIDNKKWMACSIVLLAVLIFIPLSLHLTSKKEAQDRAEELEAMQMDALMAARLTPQKIEILRTVQEVTENAGAGAVLDEYFDKDEYLLSVKPVEAYGYKNLGMANVSNHLNIREEPHEGGKLVGKMSNNAACDILGYDGDWIKIKSGDVEGYCHSDYLLVGELAKLRAESVITKEAESTSGGLRVREHPNTDSGILTTMAEGERLEVVGDEVNGWIQVMVDDQVGYISAEYAEIKEELSTAMTMTELMYGDGVSDVRVDLCQFAKKFIGNPYVWGGTSLTKGADCSGFVMSVFKQYGISLPHSSRAQAQMGTKISLGEAKPGDLVFYSGGGRINHVAIYIGGGQVVHASNPRTGIRISSASYRTISTVRRIIRD